MTIKKIAAAAVTLIFALTWVSCDNFFSSSWGKEREYDPANIDVSLGNIDEWVAGSVGRSKLASAVNQKIKEKAASATGAEKAAYMKAGAKIAVESSGISQLLVNKGLGAMSDLINDSNDSETAIKNLMNSIFSDFRAGSGPGAANDITDLLAGSLTTNPPAFNSDFRPEPGDAAEAVMVLTLDLLAKQNKTVDQLMENPTSLLSTLGLTTANGSITGAGNTNEAKVLGAYVNYLAGTSGNPIADAIKGALTNN